MVGKTFTAEKREPEVAEILKKRGWAVWWNSFFVSTIVPYNILFLTSIYPIIEKP